ncbi:hypothetical protein [Halobaculum rubrum]|uniref:hypothetical protein n=1 Tax=Halobaculum rubrum TaxID=2872158 RepID=UPI001CA3CA7A|nr:hypothetical protein [Halobaculum rubrum]QZY01215.1 hypothetical protein K6T25_15255 [Halobaculum rubrum]
MEGRGYWKWWGVGPNRAVTSRQSAQGGRDWADEPSGSFLTAGQRGPQSPEALSESRYITDSHAEWLSDIPWAVGPGVTIVDVDRDDSSRGDNPWRSFRSGGAATRPVDEVVTPAQAEAIRAAIDQPIDRCYAQATSGRAIAQ